MMPLIANSLWFASCLPAAAAFARALRDVAGAQSRALRRITGHREVEDFRRRFPLTDTIGTPRQPVTHHVPTSGTTGPTKRVPYTRSLLREFRAGIAPWVVDLFGHHPAMLAGRSYWAISPVAAEAEPFADDTEYLGRTGWLTRSALAVPPSVRHIPDIGRWRRQTLRHLVACRDLTFISIWHPSFLTLLLEEVDRPARLWPRLRVISCWGDAPELARLFPGVTIQPKGLIATEGFVSLPLCGRPGAALAVRSHFYEFIDDLGRPWLAHQLAAGREYSVVLTTGGGLNRYRLYDRVRVTGFEHQCPLLSFVGKENNVSDHYGEKVSECQVRAAMDGVQARFLMVACEGRAYTVYIESDDPADIGRRLETALMENVHYRYCRSLGQLDPVRVVRIARNAQSRYLAACRQRGQRLGNVKPVLLQRTGGWQRVFETDSLPATGPMGCQRF